MRVLEPGRPLATLSPRRRFIVPSRRFARAAVGAARLAAVVWYLAFTLGAMRRAGFGM